MQTLENYVLEGNKIIAEFDDYEILDELHYKKKGTSAVHSINFHPFEYHSSWDWQVPAWGKIGLAVKTIIPKLEEPNEPARWYFGLVTKYEKAVFQNKPEDGQKIIVQLIEWYNKNK